MAGAQVGVSSISIVEIIYLAEKNRIPSATIPLLEERLSAQPTLFETHSSSSWIMRCLFVPR